MEGTAAPDAALAQIPRWLWHKYRRKADSDAFHYLVQDPLPLSEGRARMSMKVDARRIRETRISKAWSQDGRCHGARPAHHPGIEKAGCASHESIAAIASVLAIPVDELILARSRAAVWRRNSYAIVISGVCSD
jgi:hypothetical protein